MQIKVVSSSITEPVTHATVKTFMGVLAADTSQDALIDILITAAREFFEQRTGLSVVSKSYKVYFDQSEAEDGWYEIPVFPILATPVMIVKMNDVVTTFTQTGLTRIRIRPDSVYGTLPIGASASPSYLTAEFDAGATNATANSIIIGIVSQMFNYREDGIDISIARLPFDLVARINSLTMNF
jgi:uncharacterized phiE125 gp8 family phage protein